MFWGIACLCGVSQRRALPQLIDAYVNLKVNDHNAIVAQLKSLRRNVIILGWFDFYSEQFWAKVENGVLILSSPGCRTKNKKINN